MISWSVRLSRVSLLLLMLFLRFSTLLFPRISCPGFPAQGFLFALMLFFRVSWPYWCPSPGFPSPHWRPFPGHSALADDLLQGLLRHRRSSPGFIFLRRCHCPQYFVSTSALLDGFHQPRTSHFPTELVHVTATISSRQEFHVPATCLHFPLFYDRTLFLPGRCISQDLNRRIRYKKTAQNKTIRQRQKMSVLFYCPTRLELKVVCSFCSMGQYNNRKYISLIFAFKMLFIFVSFKCLVV